MIRIRGLSPSPGAGGTPAPAPASHSDRRLKPRFAIFVHRFPPELRTLTNVRPRRAPQFGWEGRGLSHPTTRICSDLLMTDAISSSLGAECSKPRVATPL
ncbi:hypothetical protein N0V93_009680 [Gnomoniopsis smithogilvyi]|uniref:Uncharacterized protein n=1 Tax=Gnomoniopsis smithogilvyi TaxID=1191159 RepID=A0A9W8YNL7_9PEZI|nr:hypothetical protein N0V93_009680 [Gnomoniopsis smithogilvyi]